MSLTKFLFSITIACYSFENVLFQFEEKRICRFIMIACCVFFEKPLIDGRRPGCQVTVVQATSYKSMKAGKVCLCTFPFGLIWWILFPINTHLASLISSELYSTKQNSLKTVKVWAGLLVLRAQMLITLLIYHNATSWDVETVCWILLLISLNPLSIHWSLFRNWVDACSRQVAILIWQRKLENVRVYIRNF